MTADPEMMAQLRTVRLPAGYQAFSWDVVLAALSLGILAALLVLLALRVVTRRRPTALSLARDELATARKLGERERLFRQAALLDRLVAGHGGTDGPDADDRSGAGAEIADMRKTFRETLYRPGQSPDLDAIDRAILKVASSRARRGRGRQGRGQGQGPGQGQGQRAAEADRSGAAAPRRAPRKS